MKHKLALAPHVFQLVRQRILRFLVLEDRVAIGDLIDLLEFDEKGRTGRLQEVSVACRYAGAGLEPGWAGFGIELRGGARVDFHGCPLGRIPTDRMGSA